MSLSSLPLKFLGKVRFIAVMLASLIVLLTPISTFANSAWENLLQLNPKAFALGNAVSADYVGIDSLQYNPAALINLKPGFSTDFKFLGLPLLQVVRTTSQVLTPQLGDANLLYRGYTVRCDSAFKPFAGVDIRSSLTSNPGRDPLTGGVDPSVSGLNYNIPSDACYGPELINPNGVFLNDPLDEPDSDLDRTFPTPLFFPLFLPNIGYKPSEDSKVAFAAQIFSNAPVPTVSINTGSIISDIGIRRATFTPGVAFQITDKLTVGGALRISKSHLDLGIGIGAQNQIIGFINAVVQDLCTTNESRKNSNSYSPNGGAEDVSDLFGCAELYREQQRRVESGEARQSGYWPFLPWESVAQGYLSGQSSTVYSWNLGLQWKPVSWLTWGATYRTKEDDTYKVDGRIYYTPGVVSIFRGLQTNPILGAITSNLLLDGSTSDRLALEVNVPFPKAFSSGVSMQLLEKTKVNIEYRKYYYSDWKNWNIGVSSQDIAAVSFLLSEINLPAGGNDQAYYTYGIEHQWNQRLALRFGYEDRPFLSEEGQLPLYNIRMVSIGSAYQLTHDKAIDVSLTSVLLDGTKPKEIQSVSSNPLTFRGANYLREQSDAHFLLFAAKYTHRF